MAGKVGEATPSKAIDIGPKDGDEGGSCISFGTAVSGSCHSDDDGQVDRVVAGGGAGALDEADKEAYQR